MNAEQIVSRAVDAAGQAGGIDEVSAIAAKGDRRDDVFGRRHGDARRGVRYGRRCDVCHSARGAAPSVGVEPLMGRLTRAGFVSEAGRTPEHVDTIVRSRSGTPTTPNARRTHPMVTLTLSPEALGRLDAIRRERGQTRSGAVEALIRNARVTGGNLPPSTKDFFSRRRKSSARPFTSSTRGKTA
jgi:hypothetical protein